jgi:Flp pilus assembly protein TadG
MRKISMRTTKSRWVSMTLALSRRMLNDESGQLMAWMALLLMFMFLGIAALSLDVGHAMYIQHELQASADAAALAAAQRLPDTSAATGFRTVGTNYSDAGKNSYSSGVTWSAPVVTGLCLTTVTRPPFNAACSAGAGVYNAVQVTETATFHTFFAGILGHNIMKMGATATAAKEAGHWNVAFVVDTTPSMDFSDPSCGRGVSQLECAQTGIAGLLAGLDPNSDSVAMFTFPAVTVDTAKYDNSCLTGTPQVGPYVFPGASATNYTNTSTPYVTGSGRSQTTTYITYQITPFSNTFQNSGDAMQIAIGKGKCAGMQTSMEYTYMAGAIYAAQAALLNQQSTLLSAGIPSQNAMIILSDGNATGQESSPGGAFNALSNDFISTSAQAGGGSNLYASASGIYPSWVGQCGQEVDAAQAAWGNSGNPTRVYTIAYGSPTTSTKAGAPLGNCESDVGAGQHPNITPCQAMQQMASGPQYSYSDEGPGGNCAGLSAIGPAAMPSIFNGILGSLLYSRLIPNNTN